MKKEYPSLKKVKDLKEFLGSSQMLGRVLEENENNTNNFENDDLVVVDVNNKERIYVNSRRKKYTKKHGFDLKKKKYFHQKAKSQKAEQAENYGLVYKRRLFYFLLYQKQKSLRLGQEDSESVFSVNQDHLKKGFDLVKTSFFKLTRLFGLRKLKYSFSTLFIRNFVDHKKKERQSLMNINKFLCQSLQNYYGIEEVSVKLRSTQLLFLPSFKFYRRFFIKELFYFKRSRDLKKYFLETLELLYFVFGSFGKGNASLLAKFIAYLMEKNRKQLFITKFLKKSLKLFFENLPKNVLAIEGIKILIKGRFNKRRRSKSLVLYQGQISLQSLDTVLDYSQTQAITIYGSFGIKVWISKRTIALKSNN
jgi:hypothetical protein